ncbi:hypothetical protein [Streptomyces cyaneofuscatus]
MEIRQRVVEEREADAGGASPLSGLPPGGEIRPGDSEERRR